MVIVVKHGAAIVASSHTQEGQKLRLQSWDLHAFWGIGNQHGAVGADPGQAAAADQEADPLHPAAGPLPPNSDISWPKGILLSQGMLAGFSSTSLM